MTPAADAVERAKAFVTASMVDDVEAYGSLMPQSPTDLAFTIIALSKLSARMVTSLAQERGEDPSGMWRDAMVEVAALTN